MGFLDFVKGARNPGAEVTRKPEQAKTVAPTQDVKSVLTADQLAKFREVGERMAKATNHLRQESARLGDAGSADSNWALRQKQNHQDKTQAALSPTDQFAGAPAKGTRARGWER